MPDNRAAFIAARDAELAVSHLAYRMQADDAAPPAPVTLEEADEALDAYLALPEQTRSSLDAAHVLAARPGPLPSVIATRSREQQTRLARLEAEAEAAVAKRTRGEREVALAEERKAIAAGRVAAEAERARGQADAARTARETQARRDAAEAAERVRVGAEAERVKTAATGSRFWVTVKAFRDAGRIGEATADAVLGTLRTRGVTQAEAELSAALAG